MRDSTSTSAKPSSSLSSSSSRRQQLLRSVVVEQASIQLYCPENIVTLSLKLYLVLLHSILPIFPIINVQFMSSLFYLCNSCLSCLPPLYIFDRMFTKLIANPDLPFKEQRELLKSVLTVNLKQNLHEVRLQFNHNYLQIKPVFLKHPKLAIRLALALHTWQLTVESLSGSIENQVVDLLFSVVTANPQVYGQYLLTDMVKTYQDHWRMLVVLKLASEQVVQHLPVKEYGWFLAAFVRVSAAVIQGYLTTKNEKTQSNDDRSMSDKQLVNNCEQWITSAYTHMLSKLQAPKQKEEKSTVLAAFSQICGALLENERAGLLSVDKLKEIEEAALNYLIKNFSLREAGEAYLKFLSEGNFTARLNKIQIPEKYESDSELAKEGICWLIQQILKTSGELYSKEYQLQWQLLAFSQSLESPLPIKDELLTAIKIKVELKVRSQAFELTYPWGLLLFNVYQHKRDEIKLFSQLFELGADPSSDIRRWKRLLQIDLSTLNVDKVTFVVDQLTSNCTAKIEILPLIKAIRFDFTSEQLCQTVISLLSSAVTAHSEGKRVVSWLVTHERAGKRNLKFCDQLAEKFEL